ncbi:hypothetical protein HDU96_004845 [Phlyctochytrium bullatum]|nr:hypothetical protein HDU96_004845 [Phlyctochytrium bullatum]
MWNLRSRSTSPERLLADKSPTKSEGESNAGSQWSTRVDILDNQLRDAGLCIARLLLHPVIAYTAFETLRSLLAEASLAWSPADRDPWLHPSLLVLLTECTKLLVALGVVLTTTRNVSRQNLHWFALQGLLFAIHTLLSLSLLQQFSPATTSFLMQLQLPFTAVLHHLTLRKESPLGFCALFVAYLGAVVSQLTDELAIESGWAVAMGTGMAVTTAVMTVVNERMLKTLDMPFWDQQMRLYAFGAVASGAIVASRRGSLVEPEAFAPGVVAATVGAVVAGAVSGITAGFVVYKLDSVVKAISQAVITVMVTVAVFLVFGTFPAGSFLVFTIGAALLLAATFAYAQAPSSSKHDHEAYEPLDAAETATPTEPPRPTSWKWKPAALLLLSVLGSQHALLSFHATSPTTPGFRCSVDPREYLEKFPTEDGLTVLHDMDAECALATPRALAHCTVPKNIHLVLFGNHFKPHHYLAMRSMHANIRPDTIFIHGHDFPVGNELFDNATREFGLVLVPSRRVDTVFNNSVAGLEHKSDVLRLENVIRFGGMYFDLDVYVLKSLDAFLGNEATMGEQPGRGINNGMIIGKRCSRFLRHWHRNYRTFDDNQWDIHSVVLPGQLYQKNHRGLVLESEALYNHWPNRLLFAEKHDPEVWKKMHAVHSFYRDYGKEHTVEELKTLENEYGRFARHILFGGPALDEDMPPVANRTSEIDSVNGTSTTRL